MADITFTEVLHLVEQLNADEQEALAEHLQNLAKHRQFTIDEKKALFESMIVDIGLILPGYSDHREDWYGDDGR